MKELKEENLKKWKPIDFWNYSLKKYRVSKMIREIIGKNNGYNYTSLARKLGVSRQYIYNIMMMNLKPSEEFIQNLKNIINENK